MVPHYEDKLERSTSPNPSWSWEFVEKVSQRSQYLWNSYHAEQIKKGSIIKCRRKCSHGPSFGKKRIHGSSGTTPIHQYHLNRAIRKLCAQRGLTKSNSSKRSLRKRRPNITVQIDKSTCLSHNGYIMILDTKEPQMQLAIRSQKRLKKIWMFSLTSRYSQHTPLIWMRKMRCTMHPLPK